MKPLQPQQISDISGSTRSIRGVLKPQSQQEVVNIVELFRKESGARLQPISCGKNWGFGSHLPTTDDAFLLDLSGMNAILDLDLEAGSVTVQPGVTQGMLASALKERGNTHYLNVTGAGTDTSVLGNALERGIGYAGPRAEDLLDLEVVLGTGEVMHTRQWGNPFHTGLGPDLTAAFVQSDFGIVTAATLRLEKHAECSGVFLFQSWDESRIGHYLQTLSHLKSERMIFSVPHIGDKARYLNTMGASASQEHLPALRKSAPAWFGVIPMAGDVESFQIRCKYLQKRLGAEIQCQVIDTQSPSLSIRDKLLLDLALGAPNNMPLYAVSWAALGEVSRDLNLDAGHAGLIHVTPTCAPRSVHDLLEGIKSFQAPLVNIALTFNVVNAGLVVSVISIGFDKRSKEAMDQANNIASHIRLFAHSHNYLPYRLGLNDQAPKPENNIILERLKHIFDPDNIICPSKYHFNRTS